MDKAQLARSFRGAGKDYERFRPGFPAEAVSRFLPSRVGTVLDLGAGTGKLTRLLVGMADDLIAVDPSEKMLRQLRIACPTVVALVGVAEDLPLGDASVDVVTVAQAFHWFDEDRACAEISRVLRPAGLLALLRNTPDSTCAWDIACGRIAHPHLNGDIPDQDVPPVPNPLPGFKSVGAGWVRWAEEITREDYLGRWSTVSAFVVADQAQRQDLRSRMEVVLDSDPGTRGGVLRLSHATEVVVYAVAR